MRRANREWANFQGRGRTWKLKPTTNSRLVAGTVSTVMIRSWWETGCCLWTSCPHSMCWALLAKLLLWFVKQSMIHYWRFGPGRCQLMLPWSPKSAVKILAVLWQTRQSSRQSQEEARVAKPSCSSLQSCWTQADASSGPSCLHFTRFLVLLEAVSYWTWVV